MLRSWIVPVVAASLVAVLFGSAAYAGPPGSTVLLTQPPGFGPFTAPVVNDSASFAIGFDPAFTHIAAPGRRIAGGPSNTTRYVVFVSSADGISPDDDNQVTNVFVRDLATGNVTLVSQGSNGAPANGHSYAPSISADGTQVAFVSNANNLVPDNTNGYTQVYKRNLVTGTTTLVSRATGAGGNAADLSAYDPSISGDGSAVAFSSGASNLGGGSGHSQVYVRHGTTTTLVSVPDSSTTPGNNDSYSPSLSDDGDHVAFSSEATNIGVSDANSRNDVFVHTISTGHTALASVRTIAPDAGEYGDSDSDGPSISADGHRVAFVSYSRNFSTLDADTTFTRDVYVHDFSTNATFLASQGGGVRADTSSYDGSISADGNRVAFLTDAANLGAGDTNGVADVYVRDTTGGTSTTLASRCTNSAPLTEPASEPAITPSGDAVSFTTRSRGCSPDQDDDFQQTFLRTLGLSVVEPTTWISRPSGTGPFRSATNESALHGIFRSDDSPSALSGDGSIAAFVSQADEMSPDDDNRFANVFVRNAKTGATELISRASGAGGAAADASSGAPAAISDDGRYVAFESAADNLVPNDNNGHTDVFVRDRVAQTTTRVSVKSDGGELAQPSSDPDISADGQRIVFSSNAQFDPADPDTGSDVYVHDMATGTTTLASVTGAGGHANQPSFSPAISGDGNRVVFLTRATNLWPFDGNAYVDVYIHDLTDHTTKLVSAQDGSASPGNSTALAAELDFTGAHVAFSSYASNLVGADDGNADADIFVRDPASAKTTLVSGISPTQGGNGFSDRPSISADGTRVAFQTGSTDLFPGDTDGVYDVAVRDLTTGITTVASRTDGGSGAAPDRDALNPVISANGHCVAFDSAADNLVAGPPGTDFVHGYLRALDADCGTPDAAPGPGPGGSTQDTTAPTISSLRVSPSTFAVAAKPTAISARKKIAKGTKIRFTLSEAAVVRLRIELKGKGRRKGTKCVARRRTGKRCTRYVLKGTLRRTGRVGANTVAFSGRIGKRRLARGRYRLTVSATDAAGNRSAKKTASFRIV